MYKWLVSLHLCQHLVLSTLLEWGCNSYWYIVISHCGFNSHFRNFFFFWSFVFSGRYMRHMEVPRLGVELELQLPAYPPATATPDPSHVCNLHHSSQRARFSTHWARTGIKPVSPRTLVRFVNQWAMTGIPVTLFSVQLCWKGLQIPPSVPLPGFHPPTMFLLLLPRPQTTFSMQVSSLCILFSTCLAILYCLLCFLV